MACDWTYLLFVNFNVFLSTVIQTNFIYRLFTGCKWFWLNGFLRLFSPLIDWKTHTTPLCHPHTKSIEQLIGHFCWFSFFEPARERFFFFVRLWTFSFRVQITRFCSTATFYCLDCCVSIFNFGITLMCSLSLVGVLFLPYTQNIYFSTAYLISQPNSIKYCILFVMNMHRCIQFSWTNNQHFEE